MRDSQPALFLFHLEVRALEEIRCRYAGQNSSRTRRKDEPERERCCAPRCHAIRARNQLADSALNSASAWFFFHFARTSAANVTHKRRTQNAGDPVLGNNAAQLMSGYSQ